MNKCSIIDNNWFLNTHPQRVIMKIKKNKSLWVQIIVPFMNASSYIIYQYLPILRLVREQEDLTGVSDGLK